ncbi:MAG: DUF1697 domain-containing protein [Mobilitalea sp.]
MKYAMLMIINESRVEMETFAIFLRGINVNGINIKMEELAKVLESLKYQKVKTILATGNVILTTSEKELSYEDHKLRIEDKLSTHFGYEANIFIKSKEQIIQIIEESKKHEVPEGFHHYLLISNDISLGQQLKVLFEQCSKEEKEQLILGEQGIYWIVPKGNTLKSDFGNKVLGKKEFKSKLTSRTMNTVQKILANL